MNDNIFSITFALLLIQQSSEKRTPWLETMTTLLRRLCRTELLQSVFDQRFHYSRRFSETIVLFDGNKSFRNFRLFEFDQFVDPFTVIFSFRGPNSREKNLRKRKQVNVFDDKNWRQIYNVQKLYNMLRREEVKREIGLKRSNVRLKVTRCLSRDQCEDILYEIVRQIFYDFRSTMMFRYRYLFLEVIRDFDRWTRKRSRERKLKMIEEKC